MIKRRYLMHSFKILTIISCLCTSYMGLQMNMEQVEAKEIIVPTLKHIKKTLEYDDKAYLSVLREVMKGKVSCVSLPTKKTDNLYLWEHYKITIDKQIRKEDKEDKEEWIIQVRDSLMVNMSETCIYEIVFKDTTAPTIVMREKELFLYMDGDFDPQAYVEEVKDNKDKDIVCEIANPMQKEQGKYKVGDYVVTYYAKDRKGNESSEELIVHVVERPVQVMAINSDNTLVQVALAQRNKPYVWGGKGPSSFDCSGLILYVYGQINAPLTWSQIQYGQGESISLDSATWNVGDVLSYIDGSGQIVHHAMYLGNGIVIHAATNGVIVLLSKETLQGQILVRVTRYL